MKRILIITLDTPYPDNYGGAKDIWNRLQVMKQKNVIIDMVSFYDDIFRVEKIKKDIGDYFFEDSIFIKRKPKIIHFLSLFPFGVVSRKISKKHIHKLNSIFLKKYDIVEIEGLQSVGTFLSIKKLIKYNKAIIRIFNLEDEYMFALFRSESNFLKSIYYLSESIKYKIFEKCINFNKEFNLSLFISNKEINSNKIYMKNKEFIQPLITENKLCFIDDKRANNFIYVGNLKLSDNVNALKYAIQYIEKLEIKTDYKIFVCGLSNKNIVFTNKNIIPKFNISNQDLEELYSCSKFFLNFSNNSSGVKLKLFESLKNGLIVISNNNGVIGSGLESIVLNTEKLSKQSLENIINNSMENLEYWKKNRDLNYYKFISINNLNIEKYISLLGI